jgi:hypothetical protein
MLPIFADMTFEQQDYVIEQLTELARRAPQRQAAVADAVQR